MSLIRRVITLEQLAKSNAPYAFLIWRQCDSESEEEALQKYEREHGHGFPSYGIMLKITRAIKPNEDEA